MGYVSPLCQEHSGRIIMWAVNIAEMVLQVTVAQ